MFAWGLAGVFAAYLKRVDANKLWLAVFGIGWAYVFGALMNTWFCAAFVYPLTFRTFIVAQLNSIWVDTFHAVGNAIFLGLFGRKTIAILERFKKRFNWAY